MEKACCKSCGCEFAPDKKLTRDELVSEMGNRMTAVVRKAAWYRREGCSRLFEMAMVERRVFMDVIDVIKDAKTKAVLRGKLSALAYETHGYESLAQWGLVTLAENLYIENSVYFMVCSYVEEMVDF